ncbi:YIP1 family protein [Acidobacteriota bacterium]
MRCDHCGAEITVTEGVTTCPSCGNPIDLGEGAMLREDSAWERRASWFDFGALFAMIKSVLFDPAETFRRMKTGGDIGSPLLFGVILGTFGMVAGLFWNWVMQNLNLMGGEVSAEEMMIANIVMLAIAVLSPLLIAVGFFISAGIYHVCLMIVGGERSGFEATFRTVAYGNGAASLFQLVPMCGGLISMVWSIVILIIGFREMHETSTGKAVLAVFLPMIACCAVIIILAVIFGAAIMSQLANQ